MREQILEAIVARLEDPDTSIRSAAVGILKRQPRLTDKVLLSIVAFLNNQDTSIRSAAIGILGQQLHLPEGILQNIITLLNDSDTSIRSTAIDILGQQPNLPDTALQHIITSLSNPQDPYLRKAAIHALGNLLAEGNATVERATPNLSEYSSSRREGESQTK
ncbi:armadillo-type protein [Fusarium oxysporum II5]|nr:armadillo-type protein [Fusarium oxysporum II5]